ncbi:hypothetical protein FXO38_06146 [Capsicum annuum]|nr:hypothetical protein FXO38_06146 [Capsicum annuum]
MQLMYPEAYDVADRIIDLHFCKKLKDKFDQLNNPTLYCSAGFDFLVSTLDLDEEEMIKYAIEILLEEGKIKVYDCNVPVIDEVDLFFHVQLLVELLPILLRESKLMNHLPNKVLIKKSWDFEGRNKGMNLPKNDTDYACGLHTLGHIECFLIDTEIAKPMTFLCDNAVANLEEVWAYGVLNRRLEPVYIEDPVK